MKIGIFGLNIDGGVSLLKNKNWNPSWGELRNVYKILDKNKIDFIIPITKNNGWGGMQNPHGFSVESFVHAASLLEITSHFKIFLTINVYETSAFIAAKKLKSLYFIAGNSFSRIGVNLILGNDSNNVRTKYTSVHRKYQFLEKWLRILKNLLLNKNDFLSFDNKNCVDPNLIVRKLPFFITSSISKEGLSFARNKLDGRFFLQINKKYTINILKKKNKKIQNFTAILIIPAKTEKESNVKILKYKKQIDKKALKNYLKALGLVGKKVDQILNLKDKFLSLGLGMGLRIVCGTPLKIKAEIKKLEKLKINNIALAFVDYKKDLNFFINKVYPILKK